MDRSKQYQYLAHNSQNYQNQKSLTWDSGEESCYCVCHFAFALLLLFTCHSTRLLPSCAFICCKV